MRTIADEMDKAAKTFYRVEWRAGQSDWRRLLGESLDNGGGLIHRLTKKVDAVMPQVEVEGRISFDPRDELEQVTTSWATQWEAKSGDAGIQLRAAVRALAAKVPEAELPQLTLEHARAVAKSFKQNAAVVDGLHPRHPAYLSDTSLATLLRTLRGFELLGHWPEVMRTHMIKLIPKPRGGAEDRLASSGACSAFGASSGLMYCAIGLEATSRRPFLGLQKGDELQMELYDHLFEASCST